MVDAKLHPNGLWSGCHSENFVYMLGNVFSRSKEVDEIDGETGSCDGVEIRIAGFTQDLLPFGIDGQDSVALGLQVFHDLVGRPAGLFTRADKGDGPDSGQDVTQLFRAGTGHDAGETSLD